MPDDAILQPRAPVPGSTQSHAGLVPVGQLDAGRFQGLRDQLQGGSALFALSGLK
jgi:hypothetical protein